MERRVFGAKIYKVLAGMYYNTKMSGHLDNDTRFLVSQYSKYTVAFRYNRLKPGMHSSKIRLRSSDVCLSLGLSSSVDTLKNICNTGPCGSGTREDDQIYDAGTMAFAQYKLLQSCAIPASFANRITKLSLNLTMDLFRAWPQ
jgi:hypothetical protein